jgi:hypothetical protein
MNHLKMYFFIFCFVFVNEDNSLFLLKEPGVNVKTFFFLTDVTTNKLDRLSQSNLFQVSLMLTSKAKNLRLKSFITLDQVVNIINMLRLQIISKIAATGTARMLPCSARTTLSSLFFYTRNLQP